MKTIVDNNNYVLMGMRSDEKNIEYNCFGLYKNKQKAKEDMETVYINCMNALNGHMESNHIDNDSASIE